VIAGYTPRHLCKEAALFSSGYGNLAHQPLWNQRVAARYERTNDLTATISSGAKASIILLALSARTNPCPFKTTPRRVFAQIKNPTHFESFIGTSKLVPFQNRGFD
jgi:hypothetical protein